MIGHRDIDNARDAAGKEQLAKAIATAVSNHPGDYKAALSEFANAVRADKSMESVLLDRSAQVRVAPEPLRLIHVHEKVAGPHGVAAYQKTTWSAKIKWVFEKVHNLKRKAVPFHLGRLLFADKLSV